MKDDRFYQTIIFCNYSIALCGFIGLRQLHRYPNGFTIAALIYQAPLVARIAPNYAPLCFREWIVIKRKRKIRE
jgi:hypothetical protein